MKTVIAILAIAFLAITPAAARSAASFAPGHHAKGVHGASTWPREKAPAHAKCAYGCTGSFEAVN
jgi:hypothetical protein